MNSFKIALFIGKTNLLCLKRYRTYSMLEILFNRYNFKYPAEWIGILFTFIFFSIVFTGITFEKYILINNIKWANIIDLNVYFFSIIVIFEFLLSKPVFNISFLKLKIFPLSSKKITTIKYLFEIFDKKLIGLLVFLIILLLFFIATDLKSSFILYFLTITTIFITYLFTGIVIVTFRNIFPRLTNFLIYIITTVILFNIYIYNQYFNITEFKISHIIMMSVALLTIGTVLLLINLYIEKMN